MVTAMTAEVTPKDEDSGLVERSWTRTHEKGGNLTERTLEGEQVEATFLDRHGHLRHRPPGRRGRAGGRKLGRRHPEPNPRHPRCQRGREGQETF